MVDFCEERLIVGFSSSQGVEADAVELKIDFGADQAVWPVPLHGERVSQQRDLSLVVASSQVDDGSAGGFLEVKSPAVGKGPAFGSCVLTCRVASSAGRDELVGLHLEGLSGVEMETVPDLGLPASVVAFDAGLKARLTRRREDGGHFQTQAEACDASEGVRM